MRHLQIAVADDDAPVRAVLAARLTQLGHLVYSVDDGRPLVELCRYARLDLLISDVQMPGLDGLSALAAIREWSAVPAILISGGWTLEQEGHARALGAVCLGKPLLPLVLVAHLHEVQRRADARRAVEVALVS